MKEAKASRALCRLTYFCNAVLLQAAYKGVLGKASKLGNLVRLAGPGARRSREDAFEVRAGFARARMPACSGACCMC